MILILMRRKQPSRKSSLRLLKSVFCFSVDSLDFGFHPLLDHRPIVEPAAVLSNGKSIRPADIMFAPTGRSASFLGAKKPLREYTRAIVRHYLDKYKDNVPQVTQTLDVGKSPIYKTIQNGEV